MTYTLWKMRGGYFSLTPKLIISRTELMAIVKFNQEVKVLKTFLGTC